MSYANNAQGCVQHNNFLLLRIVLAGRVAELALGESTIKPELVFRVWVITTLLSLLVLIPFDWVRAIDSGNPSLESSTTYVSGLIGENTTWKSSESPYIVTDNLIVDRNVTLTLEAGVVLKFAGPYYLMIKGTLAVLGNQLAPVVFTSNASSPSPNDWKGIQSSDFYSTMNLKYARIEYATTGIYSNNSNITIANSEVSFNDVGICCFQYSHPNITQGNIIDNTIRSNNIGVKIDIYYGPVGNLRLEDNIITSNHYGVKLDFFNKEGFNVSIRQNAISLNNASGVQIKGGVPGISSVNFTRNYVTFNGLDGIDLDLWKKEAIGVFLMEDNDVHDNKLSDFKLGGQYISYVDYTFWARGNYWGTLDTVSIDRKIYDFYDYHELGKVGYVPMLGLPLELRYPDSAIDRVKPIAFFSSSGLNGTYVSSSNVSVLWGGYDVGSGIDHYAVKADHNQEVNVGTSTSFTFENLSEGTHRLFVLVFDKGGNIGEAVVDVGVDLTLPAILDVSVANGTQIRVSGYNLTWRGSDAISSIDHYEIKIGRGIWINLAGRANYTFAYLPDGAYTITLKAFDKAQNSKEISLVIVVNTSFLFGPGWTDDAVFLGGTSMVAIIGIYYFFIKGRKIKVPQETSA